MRGTAPGLGVELGREVLAALAEQGADKVKGYVASDNRAMNSMVRRMGFHLAGQVSVHDGRLSNIWVIRGRPDDPSMDPEPPDRALAPDSGVR
jgi:ribosomal protein S18 acetylase RimI-like enzyme